MTLECLPQMITDFHNTTYRRGPLHDGVPVRIGYYPYNGRNLILRLETLLGSYRRRRVAGQDMAGRFVGLQANLDSSDANNSPTTFRDSLGLTTVSVCVKAVIGFGVGGGGGTCINFGYDRKKGFSTSLTGSAGGGGFAGIGGATGVGLGMSNAPTVFELTGGSVSLGAGGGALLVGGATGYTSFNPQIQGGEIFGGLGLLLGTGITSPFAIEGFVNTTSTIIGFGTQTGFVGPHR